MNKAVITSPCVGICALDVDDVCVGCYRTGKEITHWGSMNDDERKEVLKKVAKREQASGNVIKTS